MLPLFAITKPEPLKASWTVLFTHLQNLVIGSHQHSSKIALKSSSFHNHRFALCHHHLLPGLLKEPLCGSPCFESPSLLIIAARVSLQTYKSESWLNDPSVSCLCSSDQVQNPEIAKNLYDAHLHYTLSLFPSKHHLGASLTN